MTLFGSYPHVLLQLFLSCVTHHTVHTPVCVPGKAIGLDCYDQNVEDKQISVCLVERLHLGRFRRVILATHMYSPSPKVLSHDMTTV